MTAMRANQATAYYSISKSFVYFVVFALLARRSAATPSLRIAKAASSTNDLEIELAVIAMLGISAFVE